MAHNIFLWGWKYSKLNSETDFINILLSLPFTKPGSLQLLDSPSSTDQDRLFLGCCSLEGLSGPWTPSCAVLLNVIIIIFFLPWQALSSWSLSLVLVWVMLQIPGPCAEPVLRWTQPKSNVTKTALTTTSSDLSDSSALQFSRNVHVSSLAVAHAQDTQHHSAEKPLIQCYKCGEPCKGEVLRVQNKHFHLKCFTCKGTVTHSWSMNIWKPSTFSIKISIKTGTEWVPLLFTARFGSALLHVRQS